MIFLLHSTTEENIVSCDDVQLRPRVQVKSSLCNSLKMLTSMMSQRRKSSTRIHREKSWNPLNTDTTFYCVKHEVSLNTREMHSQTGSTELGRQAVKFEPGMSAQLVNQDQSKCCFGEPQRSQVIKTEPHYQDQDEELFSLADLAGHIQPSSLGTCSSNDKHNESYQIEGSTPRSDYSVAKSFNSTEEHQRTKTVAKPHGCDSGTSRLRALRTWFSTNELTLGKTFQLRPV